MSSKNNVSNYCSIALKRSHRSSDYFSLHFGGMLALEVLYMQSPVFRCLAAQKSFRDRLATNNSSEHANVGNVGGRAG